MGRQLARGDAGVLMIVMIVMVVRVTAARGVFCLVA